MFSMLGSGKAQITSKYKIFSVQILSCGSMICESHWFPASFRVHGTTRLFQNTGCGKIMNRKPRAECGPEPGKEKGQDSDSGGPSVLQAEGSLTGLTVAALSRLSCSKPFTAK